MNSLQFFGDVRRTRLYPGSNSESVSIMDQSFSQIVDGRALLSRQTFLSAEDFHVDMSVVDAFPPTMYSVAEDSEDSEELPIPITRIDRNLKDKISIRRSEHASRTSRTRGVKRISILSDDIRERSVSNKRCKGVTKKPRKNKKDCRPTNALVLKDIRGCNVRANQLLYIYFEQAVLGCCKGISVEQIREKFQQLWTEIAFDFFKRFWTMFGFSVETETDFCSDSRLIDMSQPDERNMRDRFNEITIRHPNFEYTYLCKSNDRISQLFQRDKFSKQLVNCLTPMLLETLDMELATGFGLTDAEQSDKMKLKCRMHILHDLRDKPPPGSCDVRMLLRFQDELEDSESSKRISRYRFLSKMFERLGRKHINKRIKNWLWSCPDFKNKREEFHAVLNKLKKKRKGPQKWRKFRRKWRLEGRELTIADLVYGVPKSGEKDEVGESEPENRHLTPTPINTHIRFPDTDTEEEEEMTGGTNSDVIEEIVGAVVLDLLARVEAEAHDVTAFESYTEIGNVICVEDVCVSSEDEAEECMNENLPGPLSTGFLEYVRPNNEEEGIMQTQEGKKSNGASEGCSNNVVLINTENVFAIVETLDCSDEP